MRNRVFVFLTSSLSLLTLAACGSSSISTSAASTTTAAPTTTAVPVSTINVGNTTKNAFLWPIFVGQDQGFFKQNNLNINITLIPSGSGLVQGVVTGAIDVASDSILAFIQGISGGAKIKMVAAGANQPIYSILGSKNISSWSQLVGKRVAVDAPTGLLHYYFDVAAEANGINPASVDFIYVSNTSLMYTALASGGASAVILSSPFDAKGLAVGYNELGVVAKYLPNSPFSAFGVSTAWASQHKIALTSFVKALSQSNTWLNDPANKAAAEAILVKEEQTTQAVADSAYTSLVTQLKVFPNNAAVSSTALGSLLAGLVKAGFLSSSTNTNPQTYLDNSFAQ